MDYDIFLQRLFSFFIHAYVAGNDFARLISPAAADSLVLLQNRLSSECGMPTERYRLKVDKVQRSAVRIDIPIRPEMRYLVFDKAWCAYISPRPTNTISFFIVRSNNLVENDREIMVTWYGTTIRTEDVTWKFVEANGFHTDLVSSPGNQKGLIYAHFALFAGTETWRISGAEPDATDLRIMDKFRSIQRELHAHEKAPAPLLFDRYTPTLSRQEFDAVLDLVRELNVSTDAAYDGKLLMKDAHVARQLVEMASSFLLFMSAQAERFVPRSENRVVFTNYYDAMFFELVPPLVERRPLLNDSVSESLRAEAFCAAIREHPELGIASPEQNGDGEGIQHSEIFSAITSLQYMYDMESRRSDSILSGSYLDATLLTSFVQSFMNLYATELLAGAC